MFDVPCGDWNKGLVVKPALLDRLVTLGVKRPIVVIAEILSSAVACTVACAGASVEENNGEISLPPPVLADVTGGISVVAALKAAMDVETSEGDT